VLTLLLSVAALLMAILLLLLGTIIVRRAVADRRRRREDSLRPAIEVAVVEYLAADQPSPPSIPAGRAARHLLLLVALETAAELQGGERRRLVALLEHLGIVDEIGRTLASRRPRARRAAAETLRQIGSETSARRLSIGVHDEDLDTRVTCAAALAELADQDLLPSIIAVADADAVARPGAVAATLVTLGRTHPATIGETLAPGMSIELRRLGAAVAGELRLFEHVELLREAMTSSDDELVARAARGLGMIGDDGAVDALLALVEAEGRAWFVRLAATEALGAIGDPRAIGALERELTSDIWLLQEKAAAALRLLGGGGDRALRRAIGSPLANVSDQAKVALAR
jgi:HEAT repeat protein